MLFPLPISGALIGCCIAQNSELHMQNHPRKRLKSTYRDQLLSYFAILQARALSDSLPASFDIEIDEFLSELRAEISRNNTYLS